jgi:Winged helix-turn helix
VRWRIVDLRQWMFEEFRVTIAKQTLSRELRAMGYRKLLARPRHHAQGEGAIEDFKSFPARLEKIAREKGVDPAAIEVCLPSVPN